MKTQDVAISYVPYDELLEKGYQTIFSKDINRETWNQYYNSIFDILKDFIEQPSLQTSLIKIVFEDGRDVELSVVDYWLNLIFWHLLVYTNTLIEPRHIFFVDEFKQSSIKNYIDKYFIKPNRKLLSTRDLNNIIDDMMKLFQGIDDFSFYLSNTICLEDSIFLMKENAEFYDILHKDLSSIPMEDMKAEGMKYASRSIDIIKNSIINGHEHCFADTFRASQSINPKQYKEAFINIGPKPNGQGGIFSKPINTSFINGGLKDPVDYMIESSTGRIAQILSKMNVGNSGHFARLLGLNNTDTFLNKDPNYSCDTKRLIKLYVDSDIMLKKINNRYYRLNYNGPEYMVSYEDDKHLIGKHILLRSPITCASHARGKGICYKCYGDLAYTQNVNIGRIASEMLTAVLTQILLSAKHLIEASVKRLKWVDAFSEFFNVDGNSLVLSEFDKTGWTINIDPNYIELESDIDFSDDDEDSIYSSAYNEYIPEFIIKNGDIEHVIKTEDYDNIYISSELNEIIRKIGEPSEGYISIPINDCEDIPLFYVRLQNNDLTKVFDDIKRLLNVAAGVKSIAGIDNWLQEILKTVINSELNIDSVHMEVIMSNQVRDTEDILEKPQWHLGNEEYNIITLNNALTDNPSIIISLSYQKIGRALYNPLSFKKHGASFLDLFFMEAPHMMNLEVSTDDKIDKNGPVLSFEE